MLPMFTLSSPKNSSLDSCRKESYREKNGKPLKNNAYGIVSRGSNMLQYSLGNSLITRGARYEQCYFSPYYPYRPNSECMSGANLWRTRYERSLENAAQPSSKSVPLDAHSEGYVTGSSRSSRESSDTAIEPMKSFSARGPQNLDLSGSSFGNSPPPAYADTSPVPAEVYPRHEQGFSIQSNNERVSDFFSQSDSSSSDFSEGSPPRNSDERCGRKGDLDDDPALFENAEYSFEDVTPVTRGKGGPQLGLPRHSVTLSISSTRSPIAKRGRLVSSCESIAASPTASNKRLLSFQRYSSEFAKDIYIWLSHQETTHAIGPLFMSAQKPSGASCEDRRLVLLKAASEMRKRKYTMEAFHLGAYILDKCLDSFHVSKEALADVCAVSMVLGTKMEEYDSLTPGTVNGLAGATRDKARLCDIEKRIVYEMTDGFCFTTPLHFANYMLEELNCTDEQIRHTHYLLDLALLDSRFRDEGGSRVAHAAVCISSAIITKRESSFESECHALLEMERSLLELTKFPVGSTRDVMRGLMCEMKWAVQEKHSMLIDYLSEDNKRVCFCECSQALWDLICDDRFSFCERTNKETDTKIGCA